MQRHLCVCLLCAHCHRGARLLRCLFLCCCWTGPGCNIEVGSWSILASCSSSLHIRCLHTVQVLVKSMHAMLSISTDLRSSNSQHTHKYTQPNETSASEPGSSRHTEPAHSLQIFQAGKRGLIAVEAAGIQRRAQHPELVFSENINLSFFVSQPIFDVLASVALCGELPPAVPHVSLQRAAAAQLHVNLLPQGG